MVDWRHFFFLGRELGNLGEFCRELGITRVNFVGTYMDKLLDSGSS